MNNKNNMFELLLKIQETEDMQEKVELMQEVLLHSEFCENHDFLLQFECGAEGDVWRNETNQLKKFLEYKDKKSKTAFYGDADCDVSLAAMVAYKLLYSDLKNATLERKYNSNQRYEYLLDGVRYGGDTLTSAYTVLKRYLDFAGIQSKGLESESWNNEVYARVDEIWEQMDDSAKAFLKQYMTLGNYICIPCKGYQLPSGYWTSLNCGRSNYGKWDTVDRFLWKMHQYFYTNDSDKLLELFTGCKEALRDEVLAWNEQFHIKTWNDFVEVHMLQDFVEVVDSKNKIYGRPIGLKLGGEIDAPIDEEYDPMPQNEAECKMFFETATSCIQKRGRRMVREMDEFGLKKMAGFDLKNISNLNAKGLINLLQLEKSENSVELYINYKKKINGNIDLDDSNGSFIPVRIIYNTLWGRKESKGEKIGPYGKEKNCYLYKEGYQNFRALYIKELSLQESEEKAGPQEVLWGGDCVNSVQNQLNKKIGFEEIRKAGFEEIRKAGFEEMCNAHGCIGNFVLVPAYFNSNRPDNDNWQAALTHLQQEGWRHMVKYAPRKKNILGQSVEAKRKAEELYVAFNKANFNQYINTMFLWDYVEKVKDNYEVLNLGHNEEEKSKWLSNVTQAIRNRGIFMSAMLLIATDMNLDVTDSSEKDKWKAYDGWEVSNIYKKLMKNVFTENIVFAAYSDVFDNIKKILSEDEYDKVEGVLSSAQVAIKEIEKNKAK